MFLSWLDSQLVGSDAVGAADLMWQIKLRSALSFYIILVKFTCLRNIPLGLILISSPTKDVFEMVELFNTLVTFVESERHGQMAFRFHWLWRKKKKWLRFLAEPLSQRTKPLSLLTHAANHHSPCHLDVTFFYSCSKKWGQLDIRKIIRKQRKFQAEKDSRLDGQPTNCHPTNIPNGRRKKIERGLLGGCPCFSTTAISFLMAHSFRKFHGKKQREKVIWVWFFQCKVNNLFVSLLFHCFWDTAPSETRLPNLSPLSEWKHQNMANMNMLLLLLLLQPPPMAHLLPRRLLHRFKRKK